MIDYGWLFGTFTLAYFMGAIPFGLILTKLFGLGDIRKIGSGNIGATNVMRTGNKALGILTLLLDTGKGIAAVISAEYIYSYGFGVMAGLFVVIGHVFPVWLRFKGGKGVATTFGALFGLDWHLGIVACILWLVIFSVSRISSISSLMSISFASIAAYIISSDEVSALCIVLGGLIIYTHRSNIMRLLEGTEHNFREKTS